MLAIYQLALGAACLGFSPILVKAIQLDPTSIAIYRCLFGGGLLLLLARYREGATSLPRKVWKYIGWASLFFAADLFCWHRSVVYAGAGIGTVLANTQIFFSALIGILFLRERPGKALPIALLIASVGVSLMVDVQYTIDNPQQYWLGIGFGFATGLAYALFLLSLRKAQSFMERSDSRYIMGYLSIGTALILCLEPLAVQHVAVPQHSIDWIYLGLLALVPHVIGWWLIASSLHRIPMARAGLTLLIQPVLATVLGHMLFGEYLDQRQIFGVVLTLTAVYIGQLTRSGSQSRSTRRLRRPAAPVDTGRR